MPNADGLIRRMGQLRSAARRKSRNGTGRARARSFRLALASVPRISGEAMANVLTSTPYKINTASASSFVTQGGLPSNQPILVSMVYWLNPITIGDTFVISGPGLNLTGRCEVANQSQGFQLI